MYWIISKKDGTNGNELHFDIFDIATISNNELNLILTNQTSQNGDEDISEKILKVEKLKGEYQRKEMNEDYKEEYKDENDDIHYLKGTETHVKIKFSDDFQGFVHRKYDISWYGTTTHTVYYKNMFCERYKTAVDEGLIISDSLEEIKYAKKEIGGK